MVTSLDIITPAIADDVGADSCAVTLLGRPVDASDKLSADLEDWQFVLAEGPAVAAFRSHRAVEHNGIESIVEHCPLFAEHLFDAGIGSVAAFPIIDSGHCLGSITLYSRRPRQLGRQQRCRAADWAHQIASCVVGDLEEWAFRRHRVTPNFDLATGYVMVSSDVDAATAAALIRAHAYAHTAPLRLLCRSIVQNGLVLQARP